MIHSIQGLGNIYELPLKRKILKMNFEFMENPATLLPIIEERLPESCYLFNQIKLYIRYKEDLQIYTIGNKLGSSTWIVSFYSREDYGQTISISAPRTIATGEEPIPGNIKEVISFTPLIDWNAGLSFVCLENPLSRMIYEMSLSEKGFTTMVEPLYIYYMSREDALSLELHPSSEVTKLRRLDPNTETDFIVSNWVEAKQGTAENVRKCIEASASAGLFLGEKLVSGMISYGFGMMGGLHTLTEFRGKGHAKLTMKYAFKEYARDGCLPVTTVNVKNEGSIKLHEALRMKKIDRVFDWIIVYAPGHYN